MLKSNDKLSQEIEKEFKNLQCFDVEYIKANLRISKIRPNTKFLNNCILQLRNIRNQPKPTETF